MREGLRIHFQLFEGKLIKKEMFVAVVPCYRCYSYEHLKKHCPMDDSYKVCSNCGTEGHIFTDCNSILSKCLNCGQDHRTLAAKCTVRKNIIRKKIKEKRERSRSVGGGGGGWTDNSTTRTPASAIKETLKAAKLPKNYLAVMAAAITLAEKREAEVPGIYQYIISEMLRANGIPDVIFPDSVIEDYQQNYEAKQTEVDQESRKRNRSSEEGGGRDAVFTEITMGDPEKYEYAVTDGRWACVGLREQRKVPKLTMETPHISPQITPQITPTPTPT